MNNLAKGQGYISNDTIAYNDICDVDLNKMIRDREMYQKQGINSFKAFNERVLQKQNDYLLKFENSYNAKLINYPTGQHVTIYSKPIMSGVKKENLRKNYKNENRTTEEIEHCLQTSLNRTKNNIYAVARSVEWEWFITLTFDRKITDSSDFSTVVKKLQYFCNNLKKRKCPNLKYLIVPELHANGLNYHFHGLLSGCNELQFIDSGKRDKNKRIIYNIPSWTWGFTTATEISNTCSVSNYITKYITKESEQYLYNRHRYFTNCKKIKPEKLVVNKSDFIEMYASDISYSKTEYIKNANQIITYIEMNY